MLDVSHFFPEITQNNMSSYMGMSFAFIEYKPFNDYSRAFSDSVKFKGRIREITFSNTIIGYCLLIEEMQQTPKDISKTKISCLFQFAFNSDFNVFVREEKESSKDNLTNTSKQEGSLVSALSPTQIHIYRKNTNKNMEKSKITTNTKNQEEDDSLKSEIKSQISDFNMRKSGFFNLVASQIKVFMKSLKANKSPSVIAVSNELMDILKSHKVDYSENVGCYSIKEGNCEFLPRNEDAVLLASLNADQSNNQISDEIDEDLRIKNGKGKSIIKEMNIQTRNNLIDNIGQSYGFKKILMRAVLQCGLVTFILAFMIMYCIYSTQEQTKIESSLADSLNLAEYQKIALCSIQLIRMREWPADYGYITEYFSSHDQFIKYINNKLYNFVQNLSSYQEKISQSTTMKSDYKINMTVYANNGDLYYENASLVELYERVPLINRLHPIYLRLLLQTTLPHQYIISSYTPTP